MRCVGDVFQIEPRVFFADLILAKVKLLKFLLIDRQNKGRQYADFLYFCQWKICVDFGETQPKVSIVILQALSIWAHTNDVRRILSVFFHGI